MAFVPSVTDRTFALFKQSYAGKHEKTHCYSAYAGYFPLGHRRTGGCLHSS